MAKNGVADGAFAELAGHLHMLSMVEILVAEEYHLPVHQSLSNFLQRPCCDGLLKINTLNLCADVQGLWIDTDVLVGRGICSGTHGGVHGRAP
jgi:hypothetical protein